ncbi:uncharacterized protein JN550_006270 [Neoarthrinium moseri]|uniref:uncharacterized protein n=1 Tax=Neoarthrinium moseri TaxID=1658444 RepID=UPI001FDE0B8E|nr:uncharacterized protein JN550_006270 [Neoarthrinium moseri]KAI1868695.1 hypothetical protein JN550_006270 [Neoarthrinium moseri]
MAETEWSSEAHGVLPNSRPWTPGSRSNGISRQRAGSYVNACDQCHRRKLGCSRGKPSCERCRQSGRQCTYSLIRPAGRPRRSGSDGRRDFRPAPLFDTVKVHRQSLGDNGQRKATYDHSQKECEEMEPKTGDRSDSQGWASGGTSLTSPNFDRSDGPQNGMILDPALCSKSMPSYVTPESDRTSQRTPTHQERVSANQNQNKGCIQPAEIHNTLKATATADVYDHGPHNGIASDHFSGTHYKHQSSPPPLMAPHLGPDILDFDFDAHEPSTQAKTGPFEAINMLNEVSERFVMCDGSHSSLWYLILLALYQDADERGVPGLPSIPDSRTQVPTAEIGVSRTHDDGMTHQTEASGPVGGPQVPSWSQSSGSLLTSPKRTLEVDRDSTQRSTERSIMLKAFIIISTVSTTLPFKFGATGDGVACDLELVKVYADKLREKFERRLTKVKT